jgi:hypothetical protein
MFLRISLSSFRVSEVTHNGDFWDVTSWGLLENYRRFGLMYCLQLRGREVSRTRTLSSDYLSAMKMEAACSSKSSTATKLFDVLYQNNTELYVVSPTWHIVMSHSVTCIPFLNRHVQFITNLASISSYSLQLHWTPKHHPLKLVSPLPFLRNVLLRVLHTPPKHALNSTISPCLEATVLWKLYF